MDAKTKGKLVRLLKMTGSAYDGEALNAVRMANAILKKEGVTWDQIHFAERVSGFQEVRPQPKTETQQYSSDLRRAYEEIMREQMRGYYAQQQQSAFGSGLGAGAYSANSFDLFNQMRMQAEMMRNNAYANRDSVNSFHDRRGEEKGKTVHVDMSDCKWSMSGKEEKPVDEAPVETDASIEEKEEKKKTFFSRLGF